MPHALNKQVIEPTFLRQASNLFQQVFSQGTADTSIAHFHKLFFSTREFCATIFDKRSVNIYFAHIVYDDSHFFTVTIV